MNSLGATARAVAGFVPEPLRERIRLLRASRLEARVRRSPAVRGAALVFHEVAERAPDPTFAVDPALERSMLDTAVAYLSRRYAVVRACELASAARARKRGEAVPIAITFDDDLPSHLEHAAPVLRRHGVVATAFLCGTHSPFWWQLLQVAIDTRGLAPDALEPIPAPIVEAALDGRPGAVARLAKAIEDLPPPTRDEIAGVLEASVADPPCVLGPDGAAALADIGWEIGFHTRHHYLLTSVSEAALEAELQRAPIGTSEGLPCSLAYPHGKATPREAAAARRAGYTAAYTGRPEPFTESTDDHLIGRLQPNPASLGRFAFHVARSLSV